MTVKQLPLFERSKEEQFIEDFHPRLDEALYRLAVESPTHPFYRVAEQEMKELNEEAHNRGISPAKFGSICSFVVETPWSTPEEETFIETEEGQEIYCGPRGVLIYDGSALFRLDGTPLV